MTPENLLAEWSRLFVESLAAAGLRRVVLSPGSRSTPLACALLAAPGIALTPAVDERAAGFFALGHARVTGEAAALVCTSGSAAANYFPAIVEASRAGLPLLVITADRPFELADCGASQTIDQLKLYGGQVRAFLELGAPSSAPQALAALRRRAAQALALTFAPDPGPVHVNFRAAKPLEPRRDESPAGLELTRAVDALLAEPAPRAHRGAAPPPAEVVAGVAARLRAARRGLIVAGPLAAGSPRLRTAAARLAAVTGLPLYAEATSQLRFDQPPELPAELAVPLLGLLLETPSGRARLRPDLVLRVGEAPTSAALEVLLAGSDGPEQHVIAARGWPDPGSRAATLTLGAVAESLDALADAAAATPRGAAADDRWAETLAAAGLRAEQALASTLAASREGTEAVAARAAVAALPDGAVLVVGNSLPARHVDRYVPARRGVTVLSQRGVAGIDGLLSGAAGAAAAARRPTLALVGDLSALHDLGGLALAAAATSPLCLVVLNNGGGRIFEQLPVAAAGLPPGALDLWTTPHRASFAAAADVFGIPFARVAPGDLGGAVREALARGGPTLVEVPVPEQGARPFSAAVVQAVEAAVAPDLANLG